MIHDTLSKEDDYFGLILLPIFYVRSLPTGFASLSVVNNNKSYYEPHVQNLKNCVSIDPHISAHIKVYLSHHEWGRLKRLWP